MTDRWGGGGGKGVVEKKLKKLRREEGVQRLIFGVTLFMNAPLQKLSIQYCCMTLVKTILVDDSVVVQHFDI